MFAALLARVLLAEMLLLQQTMSPADIEAGLFSGGEGRLMGGRLALLPKV